MKQGKLPKVAYFSMEYGLENHIKTYAGGLGILAGDYIKGAKDHNFPIVGIGILWKQGYTTQMINDDGKIYDCYSNETYKEMEDTGVTVSVKIRQRDVHCKVWKYEKDTVPIYFLDTDIKDNDAADKWITGQLYGWFGEERIAQEMVLGIAGVKALRALGIDIDVFHFNEGHAVFAGFELIKEKMEKGDSFNKALKASREEIVFTTHTPIVQGNESHPLDRLFYMGANNGLTLEQMVQIGGAPFNMTVAALHTSRKSNAVAQLHNETANKMWAHVQDRSEIIGITNAIHLPTWVEKEVVKAASGKGDLWKAHTENKRRLISYVKDTTGIQLDPEVLLIGFSRRIVPYKRNSLLFTKKETIEKLFKDKKTTNCIFW
jgi:starch phosphorylase